MCIHHSGSGVLLKVHYIPIYITHMYSAYTRFYIYYSHVFCIYSSSAFVIIFFTYSGFFIHNTQVNLHIFQSDYVAF